MRLGDVLAAAGEVPAAFDAWERAAYLLPSLVGNDSPLMRIANLASARGDIPRAIDALERLLARDDTNIDAARRLAALIDPSREPARAARAWDRVAEIDPFDATASAALGRHALDTSAPDVAARWFRAALAAGPVDKAAAYCDLAESYLAVGQAPHRRGFHEQGIVVVRPLAARHSGGVRYVHLGAQALDIAACGPERSSAECTNQRCLARSAASRPASLLTADCMADSAKKSGITSPVLATRSREKRSS